MRVNDDLVREAWRGALVDLRSVLRFLDETGAPADIGAHIDFGAFKLEKAILDLQNEARSTGCHSQIE